MNSAEGSSWENEDPVAFIMSANMARRDLTQNQKAVVLAKASLYARVAGIPVSRISEALTVLRYAPAAPRGEIKNKCSLLSGIARILFQFDRITLVATRHGRPCLLRFVGGHDPKEAPSHLEASRAGSCGCHAWRRAASRVRETIVGADWYSRGTEN
jgi:hypothetical protein